ncbi:M56 family metallopeptidase [Thermicanus aegyptius]|uniref:M56 family metallopeptidase n=1 Tax=Thermicanus aegyptius TaxID=94009 RepID=UPI00146FC40C|nr:M56 family metallopeptidase [Thermicanus aegyptius]
MSVVAGALYLILKILNKLTGKYFTARWHYYSYLILYSFFLVPYYKLVPAMDLDFATRGGVRGTEGVSVTGPLQPLVSIPADHLNPAVESIHQGIASFIFQISPFIFMAGTIVFISVVLTQHFRLHLRMVQMCRLTSDGPLFNALSECRQELGIKKVIPVYISPHITTPFLYGLFKPRIVLPDMEFTPEEYRHVFLHELTHYKRRDPWVKGLMMLINAIHWFNPFACMARRDLDRFCEFSCDENVVKSMDPQERRRYCGLILNVLWNVADRQAKLYSAFSDHRKYLERRIDMILKSEGSKRKKSVRMLAFAMTLAMVFIGTAAAYAGNENATQPAITAERKLNIASEKVGGSIKNNESKHIFLDSYFESVPTPAVNGLGSEGAEVEAAVKSGSIEVIQNGSLINGLGSDDTVTLNESSGDHRFLSALPENGLNSPNPAVTTTKMTASVQPSGIEPLGTGNLSPGKGYTFDRQTIGKGSQVTINASWTPTTSDLQVGLLSQSTNTIYYATLTGGEDSATLQVNTTEEYSIYVGNPSQSTVQFDVSYIIN